MNSGGTIECTGGALGFPGTLFENHWISICPSPLVLCCCSGVKLKEIVGGVYIVATTQFAEKQTSLEPNLPTNRTFIEFYQQYNIDEHY